jgi:uncharacterized protein (DUF1499 family)
MYQQPASRIMLAITVLMTAACSTVTLPAPATEHTPIDPRLSCALPTNCVNSRTSSGLPPLRFAGAGAHGLALLQATLARFPAATVQQQDESMITAAFTTPIGFRDDVIFLLNPQLHQIDFQSHSGFGFYDFGKNRSRMQAFAARFAEVTAAANSK